VLVIRPTGKEASIITSIVSVLAVGGRGRLHMLWRITLASSGLGLQVHNQSTEIREDLLQETGLFPLNSEEA
jgi:hypothetical protein